MNDVSLPVVGASIEDLLRFDPLDPLRGELFKQGANWRKALEYPPIKLVDDYSRADLIRLAWEILRRMPRYRLQYRKLVSFGIKKSTFFLGDSGSFFTDAKLPYFRDWEDVSLVGHKCVPKKSFPEQTFGEYVAERKDGEVWFVMNRRKWVMDLWGLKYLPNPSQTFEELKDKNLFIPPASAMLIDAVNFIHPRIVSTYVRQNELLYRLRLDAPLDLQLDAVKMEFIRAQSEASKLPRDAFDPLGLPRRKMQRKVIDEYVNGGNSGVPDLNEKKGRVLLKHLELSPIWLRMWDAVQEARFQQIDSCVSGMAKKHQWPRIDRQEIISQFEQDYLNRLPTSVSDTSSILTRRSKTRKGKRNLYDVLDQSIKVAMVPNWRSRIEKYIEGGDGAFRQVVALAFAKDHADI